ncbi:amidohydrolase family protein [Pedobacter cryophilus]|uniref:Amidohydrolase n=1 Tax=Pedobacter cryophilus TaxID=2571271 RepID=A0A4U1C6G9_9SPHI|nr:amidohydrolase family protein [Pedobacter cryophilus]TKC01009.1 amidohydrolase [Pedobacter cryophilus]
MRRFSADYIFTLEGEPIQNGIVVTDDLGKILAVTNEKALSDPNIERFNGVIVPGFVNAHCHLELSHLHQKIEKGTGLIPFIKNVIGKRQEEEEKVINAMKKADEQMFQNGIVAVGDIANQSISASVKEKSNIKYHTFIEMLGFDPAKAEATIAQALKLQTHFQNSSSITPHAPYSLSKELLKNLTKFCKKVNNPISIHNQENEEENFLYRYKDGPFMEFFKEMNINVDGFKAQSKNSLQTLIPFLPDNQPILLVHNTYTSLKDIYFTKRFNLKINWCFCPNANLYIENKLPTFDFFKHNNYPITIGTDSLASNDQLCLLSEMKVLQKNIDYLSFTQLLQWATINGAKFLGFDNDLGTIATGKTPGLNLISHLKNGKLSDKSTVKKLI